MRTMSLAMVGAWAAVVGVACFVVGIVLMASSGVEVLIPETGKNGVEWIADADDGGDLFLAGGWTVVFGGVLLYVGIVGFFDRLKDASPLMILAPVLGAIGFTLVTISHVLPLALAAEFVPGYAAASGATRAGLEVDFDTFASLSLALNYTGDVLLWAVVTPMLAFAVLRTGAVPRWVGWTGIVAAVFAGWIGVFAPLSSVIDGVTFIGFVAFFVFMASLGITMLRRLPRAPEAVPAAVA